MEPLIIPIRDRRLKFAERMDLFGHGVAAFGLLTAAMDSMPGGPPAQTAVELVGAAALAGAIVREVRGRDENRPARISWLNLARRRCCSWRGMRGGAPEASWFRHRW